MADLEDIFEEDMDAGEDEDKGGEVIDPGQLEGLPKVTNDGVDDSTKFGKRFNKLYKRMKEQERVIEGYEKNVADMKTAMDTMKGFNEKLSSQIGVVAEGIKTKDKPEDKSAFIDLEIARVSQEIDKASEEEDFARVVKLNGQLTDLKLSKIFKPTPEFDVNKITEKITESVLSVVGNAKSEDVFEAWRAKNAWYDENEDARTYADAMADKLMRGGKSARETVVLVEKKVKDLFGIGKTKPGAPPVESGSYGNESPEDDGNITLSPEEKLAGKMFGISEKVLLAQKKATMRGAK